ncbi:MAG: DMT family transporter [Spirochaetales bacterium]
MCGDCTLSREESLSATALSLFFGLPLLVFLAIYEVFTSPPVWSLKLGLVILYLGLVPAALGFFAWNVGVKLLGAGGAMVFYNLLPLYGSLLGVIILKEPLTINQLVGGGLIILGGYIASKRRK